MAVGFVACDDQTEVCDQVFNADLRALFKYPRPTDGVIVDTTLPYVTVVAKGTDTLFKGATGLKNLSFSLNGTVDSTTYYIKGDSTVTGDTITFKYSRKPHFVSPGCGFATYYTLDTVIFTRYAIDSIRILNREVTTNDDTHLYLFY
ncbi:hypothetical protein COR50_02335 [Chitinophaga caeni]|uniref:Uncharacterized protein n=2 Tax=Chitinophaga caeni TaxID=2029983 RepID=A0A291QQ98_9BACT|nr:hypothetical protein COR50_02335 [Chitinophaga caeni]